MKKRLLSIILALITALGLFASFPVGAADTRDPFQELAFSTYDDYSAEPAPRVWQNHGIYEQKDGYWIAFKNLNFSSTPKSVTLSVYSYQSTSVQKGYIELRLDAPDGRLIAEITPKPSVDWVTTADTMVEITEEVTGVHDLYAVYRGTHYDNRVAAIRFSPTGESFLRVNGKAPSLIYKDAADEYMHKTADKLVHLGLMTPEDNAYFGFESPLTVEEALCAAARMQGMDFRTGVMAEGRSEAQYYKMFGYDKAADFGKYVGGDPITAEDFTGLVLGALGWGNVMKAENSTVMRKAAELKLFSGVSGVSSATFVTKGQAALILENAIDAKALVVSGYTKDGVIYDVVNKDGIMSVYDNVYRWEGVVEQNHLTSAGSGAAKLKLTEIKMNGMIFGTGNTDILHAVGKSVDFYFRHDEDADTYTILYYEENNTLQVEISSEQLISLGMSRVEYELNGKVKSVNFNQACPVIYNGTYAKGYTTISSLVGDLESFKGSIAFVNNDGDKDYDLIIIESYKSAVLKFFNEKDGIITDEDGTQYDLKAGNPEFKYMSYDESGASADLTLAPAGTVLDIATSHSTGDVTFNKIIVCSNSFYGEVNGLGEDGIIVDDVTYKPAAEFKAANYTSNKTRVEPGSLGTFYLDSFGYIRSFESGARTMTALVVDYATAGNAFEDKFLFKLFTDGGEMVIWNCAEKITVDGNRAENHNGLKDYLDNQAVKGTVVIYRVNGKNEVNMIDTIAKGKGDDKDQLEVIRTNTNNQLLNGIFFGNLESAAAFDGGTVFNAPYAGSENEGDAAAYGVQTTLSGSSRSYDLYSTKGNKYLCDVAVCYLESRGNSGEAFVVEGKKTIMTDDGDITVAVDGWFMGTRPERGTVIFDTISGYEKCFTDEIVLGDVIRPAYNAKGLAVNAGSTVTVPSNIKKSAIVATDKLGTVNGTINGTQSSETVFWHGEVVDIMNGKYMVIETTAGKPLVLNISGAKPLLYESGINKAREVGINEIILRNGDTVGTGTKVLITVNQFKAGTVLFYN